jgi:hypothetical protein
MHLCFHHLLADADRTNKSLKKNMNHDTARKLAIEAIGKCWNIDDDEPIIIDNATREENFGWLFFWTSKKYYETKDIRHALGGNGPVVIRRDTKDSFFLATCYSIDRQIEDMRQGKEPKRL